MACAWGHKTYHSDCDACDASSNDPDTGWIGFTDHFLGKHFNSEKERSDYIESKKSQGDEYEDE